MKTPPCASPRCYLDPTTGEYAPFPAAPGLRLCWGCRDRLLAHLGELPALYIELERLLAAATGGSNEKVSGTATRALPVNPAVMDARANIRAVLGSWAGMVADERTSLRAPTRNVASLAPFLARSGDWLAAHPASGDAAVEFGELVTAARRATQQNPARRIPLGDCPVRDCVGAMTAVLRDPGGRRPSEIVCDTDTEHTWAADVWLLNRRMLRAGAR